MDYFHKTSKWLQELPANHPS